MDVDSNKMLTAIRTSPMGGGGGIGPNPLHPSWLLKALDQEIMYL